MLTDAGWTVLYSCVPGTAHVGVVPIPTRTAHSQQRYPDVLATLGETTLLVEIEPRLNPAVANEMANRFQDHVEALSNPATWSSWRLQVQRVTGSTLPDVFIPRCELVVIREPIPPTETAALEGDGICVSSVSAYTPSST
jgi:hypothetical protein